MFSEKDLEKDCGPQRDQGYSRSFYQFILYKQQHSLRIILW